ncbi:MAG: hypothetical protein NWT00_04570 [Beijerinckiaceae bacterium]|jgi:hypothetical protein|nr:hypothetical protein [Beijerinckiaceae bacterium]
MDPAQDLGIPGGRELLAFSDAVIGPDRAALDEARTALEKSLGPAAVSAASIIAATFTKNDRIANGVGLPAEPRMMSSGEDIRELLKLKAFGSAVNTYRHSPEGEKNPG